MTFSPSPRDRSGFTLVEVLVTLAIMALVMLGLNVTLDTAVFTHDDMAIDIAQVREGPRILDLIERDIRAMHLYNIANMEVLNGTSQSHFGHRGDRLDLLTCSDSTSRLYDPEGSADYPNPLASDITEVGYRARPRPDHDDFLELYRREDFFVDEDPMEGGRYEMLHDRVTWFEISYMRQLGPTAEVDEDWLMEKRQNLPAAIVIHLRLQAQPELIGDHLANLDSAAMEYTYKRVVPLHKNLEQALLVRPALPVPVTSGGSGGPGGAGGVGGAGSGMATLSREQATQSLIDQGGKRGSVVDRGGGVSTRGSGGLGNLLDGGFQMGGGAGGPSLNPGDQQALEDLLQQYGKDFNTGRGKGGGGGGGGR